tara:strand:- start:46 stop:324 length:279 start_codon:yes stop_codon:yes gene_type:complete
MTIENNIPSPEIMAKLNELNGWSVQRKNSFEKITEQLDMLFHDINNGKFGENAKTSQFYLHIKGIKDANPKPTNSELESIKSELDALITAEE